MKFLRRTPQCQQKSGDSGEPSAKRGRVYDSSYEENVAKLMDEMRKRKRDRKIAVVQQLTSDTFQGRRDWLKKYQPLTSDILSKFPSLKLRKVVGNNYSRVSDQLPDRSLSRQLYLTNELCITDLTASLVDQAPVTLHTRVGVLATKQHPAGGATIPLSGNRSF